MNISLKQKLLFSLVLAGLLPLLTISVVIDIQAGNALKTQAFNQLISVRDIKKQQIEQYLIEINHQIETLSKSAMIIDAAKGFSFGFKMLPVQLSGEVNVDDAQSQLAGYYQNDFANQYQAQTGKAVTGEKLVPKQANEVLAQFTYIQRNSNPLGEKHKLNSVEDGTTYDNLHKRYHPIIRDYLEKFGYYDIFLVEPESGSIVYSVFKELDFATSLRTGPYSNTNFAQVFKQAAAATDPNSIFITDFEPYTPSYEAPASFIASPVYEDEKKVGVLIFQMPVDRINQIMGQRSGLGETGETYMIGDDFLMRSQSHFDEANSILRTKVETTSAKAVVADQTGTDIIVDIHGDSVLSVYAPLSIEGLHWGILAEVKEDEAFAAISTLHWITSVVAIVVACVLLVLALLFARSVYRQLGGDPRDIEEIAGHIADGNLDIQTSSSNPTGVYASMLQMKDKLTGAIENDIQGIVNAARGGDLSQRVDVTSKQGFYKDLGVGVNDLVDASDNIVSDTLRVFGALSHGNLNETYHAEYQGAFDQVKQNANSTVARIKQVIDGDIQGLVRAASEGDLSRRIDTSDKQGFFAELSNNINNLLDSVEQIFTDTFSTMEALADGDLNQSIDNNYQGQFDKLKKNINSTVEKLDKTVIELLDSGDIILASSGEINQGNANLSARTEQQAAALEQTAASLEELSSTVRNNADNTAKADQLAGDAKDSAVHGGEVMLQASDAMEDINQSSQQIAEIIGVIDEIAFQTNLLALNASVEAARAGEQGRGFAVVATEVRNLAGRSATAAKEIKELIHDSVAKVGNGVDLVKQSNESLNEIVGGITKVVDIINEISAASAEQATGIDQVSQAVNNMEDITQQNASLAEQTSAASISMTDQANQMSRLLNFFKVSEERSPLKTSVSAATKPSPVQSKPAQKTTTESLPASGPAPAASAAAENPDFDDDEWEEF